MEEENKKLSYVTKSVVQLLFEDELKKAIEEGDEKKIELLKRHLRRLENIKTD